MPLHSLASGKAILAYLSDERIEEILESRGLSDQTPNTITTRQTLYEKVLAAANEIEIMLQR